MRLLCFAVLLTGCVTHEVRKVDMTPPKQMPRIQEEHELLDVGIAVFDANVPEDFDTQVEELIQPEVRRAEANFMPYVAKNLLQSTGNWGAVRVVPRPTNAVDVSVTGKILESNGERLTVELAVTDATGKQWFSKPYHALASKYSYDDTIPRNVDPFQGVYKALADDMLAYRTQLSDEDIARIRTTAEMKFAREFSPDAFSAHVSQTEDGFELMRTPAPNDPMLERVRKIREREYLFIDTLDTYFANYHDKMYPAYHSWRGATYDEAIAHRELKAKSRARAISGTAAIIGGVASMYESDNAYVDASSIVSVIGGVSLIKSAIAKRHEAEMHAEVLREIGEATEAEVMPHTMELENQSVRLQGSVDEQYTELRRILRRLYFEDLGLPVPEDALPPEPDTGAPLPSPTAATVHPASS